MIIKVILFSAAAATGFAFAAGCYVGWKTTLKVLDSVNVQKMPVPSGT